MPSPFPGMNPYLEQPDLWRNFHNGMLYTLQEVLTPLVVPRYFVEYEETVHIDRSGDIRPRLAVADVAVSEAGPAVAEPATTTVAAPVTVAVPVRRGVRRTRRRLLIRDARRRTVVTVIELLSPSDKTAGDTRRRVLRKRADTLASRASLVEIDLLRGGRRMPIDGLPRCDYYALVSRAADRPRAGLWSLTLRDPLPTIPIPLSAGPEPTVSLKTLLDRVYDGAGFGYRIYNGSPVPRLSPTDAAWAAGFVPAGGR
jgi:hypothetical protein